MIVSKEMCAQFNHMCYDMRGKEINSKEMKKILRDLSLLPNNANLLSYLVKGVNPPIYRVRRGVYMVNDRPVHIQRLQTCMDDMRKNMNKARSKWTQKNKLNTEISELDKLGEQIAKAAKLLKDNGWLLKRPLTIYEDY